LPVIVPPTLKLEITSTNCESQVIEVVCTPAESEVINLSLPGTIPGLTVPATSPRICEEILSNAPSYALNRNVYIWSSVWITVGARIVPLFLRNSRTLEV
jgi:hypothetical protein